MTNHLAVIFLVVVLHSSAVGAAPGPVIDLAELVSRSDAVVTGHAVAIRDAGPDSIATPNGPLRGTRVVVDVNVNQVLKGDVSPGLRFEFVHTDLPSVYGGVPLNSPRVFFLQRQDLRWVVDPYHPSLPAVAGRGIGAAPLERVVAAVGAVLTDASAPLGTRLEAIEALRSVPLPESREVLQRAATDPQADVRYRAIAALLSMGDLAMLPAAAEALLAGRLHPDFALTLRGGIWIGARDAAAVPALARLLRAGDVETRRTASFVLARIESPTVVPVLRGSLDDADSEVRFNAVRGVATLLGHRELVPSELEFRADQGRFIKAVKALAGDSQP